jgi:hypothetical protein
VKVNLVIRSSVWVGDFNLNFLEHLESTESVLIN